MTARIERETKLDSAVHATLALMSSSGSPPATTQALSSRRRIKSFLPPSRGREHIEAALEALYAIEPEMIEPSTRARFELSRE